MHRIRFPLLGLLAASVVAQNQFAETVKAHMPAERGATYGMAIGDVNGDGHLDAFYGNAWIVNGSQNSLHLGDGAGNMTDVTATHLPAKLTNTHDLELGDVDGDGDLDAYLADYWQDRLYLNDGTGRFTDATFGRLPNDRVDTRRALLRDFDGDGDLDVATAEYHVQRLLLNNGTGFFTDAGPAYVPLVDVSTWNLAAADVDGDGDLDLGFATFTTPLLWINDGAGHFTDVSLARLPAPPNNVSGIAFGDLDGDGDQDLVFAAWTNPGTLYLNSGSGTFVNATAGRLPAYSDYCWEARLGDVDADGDLDLMTTNVDGPERLLLNQGNATFVDVTSTHMPRGQTATVDLALGDFDQDGDLDALPADAGQQKRLLLNDGVGRFADNSPSRLTDPSASTAAVALGDLDGDGDLDLVTGNRNFGGYAYANEVFVNDGRGSMTQMPANLVADSDDTRAVALADVDGDADLDIVFGNHGVPCKLHRNAGNAVFTDASGLLPSTADHVAALACGDVDQDGDVDCVVGNLLQPNRLWLNNGSGTFVDAGSSYLPAAASETRALALGDLDNDGDLDLMVANGLATGRPEGLFFNDGTGHFVDASAQLPIDANPTSSLALGDVDNDGDLDVVLGHDDLAQGRSNSLWLNSGLGTFVDYSYTHMVYDWARTTSVLLRDFDEDGDYDIVVGDYNQWNKFYANDGTGRFTDETLERMPNVYESTTALAAGDLDGDGDFDFVGACDGQTRWENGVYINHLRQVNTPLLPRLGRPYQIDVLSQGGYALQPQSAILLLGGTPASIPLPPYGTLGVSPIGMATIPMALSAPSGKGSLPLALPLAPALAGVPFYLQALVIPSANPSQARLTNVQAERFVR